MDIEFGQRQVGEAATGAEVMFILTKRSAFSDGGLLCHSIYGRTEFVGEARAWFRASRATDVIEIHTGRISPPTGYEGNGYESFISDTRLGSWREQQYTNEKLLAAQKGKT